MGKVALGINMSLDGFINDADGSVGLLYPDFEAMRESEQLQEAIRTTGAVVMGRRTFEMGDPDSYADYCEFQAPIFVLTHHPPEKMPRQNDQQTFTFVSEGVESAMRRAGRRNPGGHHAAAVGRWPAVARQVGQPAGDAGTDQHGRVACRGRDQPHLQDSQIDPVSGHHHRLNPVI